jgi:ribokinase
MQHDVVTIGAATRDLFVKSTAFEVHQRGEDEGGALEGCFPLGAKIEIDELVFETGGGATNAAVTFSRLGHRSATISAVGDDDNGRGLLDALKRERVSASYVQRIEGVQTGTSIIAVAGTGERTVLVYRGASQAIDPSSVPWPRIKSRWFYVSSLGGNAALMEAALGHANRHGIAVAWNPGAKELKDGLKALAKTIRSVDVLNLNREEAAHLCNLPPSDLKGIIAALRTLPRRLLVVTDGQAGAYAATKDEVLKSGTMDVPRVNVTGAGDAFGSGVIAGLLKKDDVRYALAVGTWNATGVVQQMGAKLGIIRAYPTPQAAKKVAITTWTP